MQSLAFLCLGTMGYPMAGHLARAGHRLTVWNRTRARAEGWAAEFGGAVAVTPAEAARAAGWTILRGLSCVLPGVALCVVLLLKGVHVQRIRLLSRHGPWACDYHFGGQVSAPFSSCRGQ